MPVKTFIALFILSVGSSISLIGQTSTANPVKNDSTITQQENILVMISPVKYNFKEKEVAGTIR